MAPSLISVLSLFLLLLSPPAISAASPSIQPECATSKSASVPVRSSNPPPSQSTGFSTPPTFISTLQSTISQIQNVVSIISTFTGAFGGDLRLSSAVSDCLDLLDLSSDELTWSLATSQPTTATATANTKPIVGTGNQRSDLRSWLSAALGNQDTCKESLDSTNSIIGSLIGTGLQMVTSLVADGLQQVTPSGGRGRNLLGGTREGFPKWVTAGERRLLQMPSVSVVNATVAQDGSGNYTTVSDAVAAAPAENVGRWIIHVKSGVYKENVEIKKKKWNIMIFGDGMDSTVISASRNFIDGWTTYRSATFAVSGKGFIARDITFENTAGPEKHQAVALRSDSDLSVFYRVGVRGYQDSLYAHALRQFYRECRISGTVDFIFGNAAAVFQNCLVIARRPLPNQKNSVTAQGRKDPNQNTGFALQFCNITADSDLASANQTVWTYLGRPWKEYSRTVVMQSYLGSAIRPEGWLAWQDDFALATLYYAEYMNYGPGSPLGNRVKWEGYHPISDPAQVINFTVAQFIDGNLWLPSTGVKFASGLSL